MSLYCRMAVAPAKGSLVCRVLGGLRFCVYPLSAHRKQTNNRSSFAQAVQRGQEHGEVGIWHCLTLESLEAGESGKPLVTFAADSSTCGNAFS